MSKIGFIGLGCMGYHMANNLLKNGLKLIVFDSNPITLKRLANKNVDIAKNPAEIAAESKKIITMLPEGHDVFEVFNGKNGILETITNDTICMDSSTIDQSTSLKISELVAIKKAFFFDAPVSGGVVGAENGTLTFMVGGNKAKYNNMKDFFNYMGKNSFYCGTNGTGLAAKICNNMLLGIQMIGVAEAMNLGIKLGLNSNILANIINTSTGRCWSSDTYNPVPGINKNTPSSNNYHGGFRVDLINKDLSLAEKCATEVKAPILMGAVAHQIYQILNKNPKYKQKDLGVIYEFLKEFN